MVGWLAEHCSVAQPGQPLRRSDVTNCVGLTAGMSAASMSNLSAQNPGYAERAKNRFPHRVGTASKRENATLSQQPTLYQSDSPPRLAYRCCLLCFRDAGAIPRYRVQRLIDINHSGQPGVQYKSSSDILPMKKRVGGEQKHTVSDQNVLLDEVPRFKCGALEILRCTPTA